MNPSLRAYMKLPNFKRPISTASITVTGDKLLKDWKTNLRRLRPSNGPNHCRIACHSMKMVFQTRRRIMRLAPLLFDKYAIEREVAKRLRAANESLLQLPCFQNQPGCKGSASRNRDILAEAPDLLEIAKEKFTREVVDQAWLNLSPDKLKTLQFEWNVYLLALTVSARAWKIVSTKVGAKNLSPADSLAVLLLPCEFRGNHRWSSPPQAEQLNAGFFSSVPPTAATPAMNIVAARPRCQELCPPWQQPHAATQPTNMTAEKRLNQEFYSKKIIRLTTYLSALHEAQDNSQPPSEIAV